MKGRLIELHYAIRSPMVIPKQRSGSKKPQLEAAAAAGAGEASTQAKADARKKQQLETQQAKAKALLSQNVVAAQIATASKGAAKSSTQGGVDEPVQPAEGKVLKHQRDLSRVQERENKNNKDQKPIKTHQRTLWMNRIGHHFWSITRPQGLNCDTLKRSYLCGRKEMISWTNCVIIC